MIKSPTKHRKLILIILASLSSIALISWGVFLLTPQNTNRAAEVAKPLEQALVEAGGIKMCSNGDDGRGWDNRSPWYQVVYDMPFDVAKAERLANETAANNGYNLTHASVADRGPLGVADIYVDKWYYDYSSKPVSYGDMEAGKVQLAFIVDGAGSTYECGKQKIQSDHSVMGIDLRLSAYK